MYTILRQDAPNEDFLTLDGELTQYYYDRFGEVTLKYRAYNGLGEVTDFFLAYEGSMPVGIACFRPFSADEAELKRVYVRSAYRQKGIARALVRAAEERARERGYRFMSLETGGKNAEALSLYENTGYALVPNFPQFDGDAYCVCMRKEL